MSKRFLAAIALLATAGVLLLTACGSESTTTTDSKTQASTDPILVGVPISVTGFSAADGELARQGIEFAIDEINAQGGVLGRQLQMEIFDIQDLSPERLLLAADTLVAEKGCDVSVTCWAGSGADIQAFGKYPNPFFCADGSSEAIDVIKEGGYTNTFHLIDGELPQAEYMFDFMRDLPYEYPNNKVMTIGSDDDWGHAMTGAFGDRARESGWEVIEEYVPYETANWGPILSKVSSQKPSMLYLEVDMAPAMITFLRQFKQNPTDTLLLYGFALQLRDFLDTAGPEANGVLGMTPGMGYPMPSKTEEGEQWNQRFIAKYGSPIAGGGANDYAAVKMWAQAVEAVGDPTKYKEINDYIRSTTFDVVPGWVPMKFNEDNYISMSVLPMALGQLQDENLVTLDYAGPYTDWQGNQTALQIPSWIE
jgi:branched-chain amino acid transport system substrate-binding protein